MSKKARKLTAVLCTALIIFSILPSFAAAAEPDKLVALTFDDGPGKYTEDLLDGLEARGATATFFVVGTQAAKYPETLRRIAVDGHQLASHTYGHSQLTRLSTDGVKSQLSMVNDYLIAAGGEQSYALRPPYGSHNERVRETADVPIIMWSVDPLDWKYRNVKTVANNIMSSVQDGDIVLLHDIHQTSVEAAFIVIDKLQAEGYEFVTVSELLRRRGVEITNGEVYYSARNHGTTLAPASDKDTLSEHWAYSSISYSLTHSLIDTFVDGSFRPDYSMGRGAFAAALGKLYEQAGGTLTSPGDRVFSFSDVPESAQYMKYVQWAANAGIMTGYGDGTFGYYNSITREQLSACIVRYLEYVGLNTAGSSADSLPYGDAGSIADWAVDGVKYCTGIGIFKGDDKGDFNPKGRMTRAQAATVLQRIDAIDGSRCFPSVTAPPSYTKTAAESDSAKAAPDTESVVTLISPFKLMLASIVNFFKSIF